MSATTATATLLLASAARAADVSPPAILQWFESSYKTIENRTPDLFMAGYGAVWTPPPGRADISNFSVGYDVYDRFDLGSPGNPTLFGTETGIKTLANTVHRAGMDYHVDFVMNHNGYSGTGSNEQNNAFKAAGGYPGFFSEFFNDVDGDFNSAYRYDDVQGRLAGLIDIAHEKNYRAVRSPVPGFANNIAAGTTPQFGRLANVARESNRRFYPDRNLQPIMVFDPKTGERDIPVYPFNRANPMAGDPVEENALGYLMRNAQWLVQEVGVDGLRIDAAKHVDGFVLDYIDRSVYRQNPRNLLDGSTKHVFAYSETFTGDPNVLLPHVQKTIDNNNPGRIGGNRDTLDFKLYFALKANLENPGTANAWQNIKGAALDLSDDGKHNGSAGVKFASNHDVHKPFSLDNLAHAYVLMMPGNATVYFNGKEFGDNRDFPKDGRSDALSVRGNGSHVTRLLAARNTHGRGDYAERWDGTDGLFAFERVSSAVTLLSNRGDNGYDERTLTNVGFAPGTHLIDLTGNASDPTVDPNNNIPEVVTVGQGGTLNVRFPRNRNANGVFHGNGYVVYGLPTPQSANGLELTNVAAVLPGSSNISNNYQNGTTRQTDVHVVKANSFQVSLRTNEVRLLGSDALRDVYADGDGALLKVDGGLDVNNNGRVDFTTPNEVSYGFERFGDKSSPLIGGGGIGGPRGDGQFVQTIDATKLEEGYHFLESRAFRHRTDNGPAVFSSFKKVVYVDRLKPVSEVADFVPYEQGVNQNRDLMVRSADKTADSVHVFLNLPAAMTEQQVLALVGANNKASQIDRDLFKYGFSDIKNGNNVATVVTYEMTGTYNVQRIPGLNPATPLGRGLGDLNFNSLLEPGDVGGTDYGFEAVLYARDQRFNPAADLNADGRVTNLDLYRLPNGLRAGGADANTITAANDAVRRRGNLNGDGFTNASDIDGMLRRRGTPNDWVFDLDANGVLAQNDVFTLVGTILSTSLGDANLDGRVDSTDQAILTANFGQTGTGWARADFNGDDVTNQLDRDILAAHFGAVGPTPGETGVEVPEPTAMAAGLLLGCAGLLRRRRRQRP